jgi:hypothetical protein
MNEKLKERLNKILPRIESEEFLEGRGLGNEVSFYIFDYPPEEELTLYRGKNKRFYSMNCLSLTVICAFSKSTQVAGNKRFANCVGSG